MKIYHLTDAVIESVTNLWGHGTVVAVKKGGDDGTWWEGYCQAKHKGYHTTKHGEKWYGACLHWYGTFVAQMQHYYEESQWGLLINGVGANNNVDLQEFVTALTIRFHTLGIACAHPPTDGHIWSGTKVVATLSNPPTPIVASVPAKANKTVTAKAKPKPKVEAPPPPGELIEAAPIDAAPLPDGTMTGHEAVAYVRQHVRPVYPAVTSMYLLEELYLAATKHTLPVNADHRPAVAFARKLLAMHAEFSHTLARNFFDFLAMASFGEFRYGAKSHHDHYSVFVDGTEVAIGASRATAYAVATQCDPRTMLPIIASAFRRKSWWGSTVGGVKWAKIAEAAATFYTMRHVPLVFCDHVVDIQHNGGLAFNKNYLIGNPSHEHPYNAMLNRKRASTLLDSKLNLDVTVEVSDLVFDAEKLGIIPKPTCTLDPVADVPVPALTWGTGTLTVRVKGGATLPTEDTNEPHVYTSLKVNAYDSLNTAFSGTHGTGTTTELPPDA